MKVPNAKKHMITGAAALLAMSAFGITGYPAIAAEGEADGPPPGEPADTTSIDAPSDSLKITAPAANANVDTAFTISGTISPNCSLIDHVYLTSEKSRESYAIAAPPQQNGDTFSIQVDTALAGKIGKENEQLVPEVPPSGPIIVFITSDAAKCQTTEPDANSFTANLQHSTTPVAKSQPRPLPSVPPRLADLMIKPDKPYDETDDEYGKKVEAKGTDRKIPTEVWLVLGLCGGIGAVILAEYSAYRYHKRRKKR